MTDSFPLSKLLLFTLTLFLYQQPVAAKKMYKWVDENGKTIFSDKIPPSQVKLKREKIDSNADVVEVIPKAKTKAELEMEKRLNILRRQQEKLIKAQENHDKVLLSTFRSLKDMEATYDKKLAAYDAQRRITENALDRAKEHLQKQQKKAADHDINNRAIPEELSTGMISSKKQIETIQQKIQKHVETRKQAEKEFAADISRFAFLTQADRGEGKAPRIQTKTEKQVEQLGLFSCQDNEECSRAWKAARAFVVNHSNTEISIDTDQIIMTKPPISAMALSLSVSKMQEKGRTPQIFLDIRCKDSIQGRELCVSAKAESIRTKFNHSIKVSLGLVAPKKQEETE